MYADLFGIEKSDGNLSSHIYNASLGAQWHFAKKLGFGAEYSSTRGKIDGDTRKENLDPKIEDPTVYLTARL